MRLMMPQLRRGYENYYITNTKKVIAKSLNFVTLFLGTSSLELCFLAVCVIYLYNRFVL